MMGKDAWVAGADRREAPGPRPVRLGRRLRLRRQPPGSWQLWNGGVERGVWSFPSIEVAMRWIFRSGGLGAVGLMLVAVSARFATAAILPVGSLGVTPAAQGEYGTIKGRLVWGGSDVPPARVLIEKGQAQKDPEICAREAAIPNRELVVDPKTKGVVYGFAYLVKPKGSNPGAVKELLARSPKVELDQKNCEFLPYVLAIHQDQPLVI